MVTIRSASVADIPRIRQLTQIIWPATYGPILSSKQIAYMLDMMYSVDSLRKQIDELHYRFLISYDDTEPVGFASYSPIGESIYKLHKIYVLPNRQGKGIGKFIIGHIVDAIRRQGTIALELNVNRHNPARTFIVTHDSRSTHVP